MHYQRWFFLLLMLAVGMALLGGCAEQPGPAQEPVQTATPRGLLTPYRSPTSTVMPTPTDPATPTPLPSPTPTPRTHEVIKGEDMFGIALRYGVSLEMLRTANPTVDPNFLSIGTRLTIPQSETPQPTGSPSAPTPAPVELSPVTCTPAADGGIWCMMLALNPQESAVESVSARVRVTDRQAQTYLTQTAFLLLDRLPANTQMPLAVYFTPNEAAALSGPYQAGAELLTALSGVEDGRYLAVSLTNQTARISEDGLSADLEAEVRLDAEDGTAARVWVLAAAYAADGHVVGVRRWENSVNTPLSGGQALTAAFSVYSLAGPIDHVEMFAEARP